MSDCTLVFMQILLRVLYPWAVFQTSFKTACFQPLVKKPGLDQTVLENYQTISKPFFRQRHSTETGLLKVTNDLLMSNDAGMCSILVLFDLI